MLRDLSMGRFRFGLRHGFDVDYIEAIDNTVRKLLRQNQDPTGVRFFSLGIRLSYLSCRSLVVGVSRLKQRTREPPSVVARRYQHRYNEATNLPYHRKSTAKNLGFQDDNGNVHMLDKFGLATGKIHPETMRTIRKLGDV